MYSTAGLDAWYGTDLKKNAMACIVPDDVQWVVADAYIKSLNPYDEFANKKYITILQTMDKFNWAPCQDDKELMELAYKIGVEWTEFWSQKDIEKIVDKNMKKNWSKITKIVPELQKEWAEQNYEKAGVLAT